MGPVNGHPELTMDQDNFPFLKALQPATTAIKALHKRTHNARKEARKRPISDRVDTRKSGDALHVVPAAEQQDGVLVHQHINYEKSSAVSMDLAITRYRPPAGLRSVSFLTCGSNDPPKNLSEQKEMFGILLVPADRRLFTSRNFGSALVVGKGRP